MSYVSPSFVSRRALVARLPHLPALLLLLMLGPGFLTGCGQGAGDETLLASVAANLRPVMLELGEMYAAQTGEEVAFNFASSGKLAQQIHEGAPVDVFISANARYVDELAATGLVRPDTAQVVAVGRLAVWTSGPRALSLADLSQPEIGRIAIANPEHAPYGEAARQTLQTAGLWDDVSSRLVYAENVLQAFQFVESGDVDAAIVALSQARSAGGRWTLVDASLHQPLQQMGVVVANSRRPEDARRFLTFLASPQARPVWEEYGYEIPAEAASP